MRREFTPVLSGLVQKKLMKGVMRIMARKSLEVSGI